MALTLLGFKHFATHILLEMTMEVQLMGYYLSMQCYLEGVMIYLLQILHILSVWTELSLQLLLIRSYYFSNPLRLEDGSKHCVIMALMQILPTEYFWNKDIRIHP